jgi:Beta-galactosidase, domain 2
LKGSSKCSQAIQEDRTITREKYSEAKLQAQFLNVSPGYLLSTPSNLTVGKYSDNPAITVTPLIGNGTGSFFVVRHTDYTSTGFATYTLNLPTSAGTILVPQLNGSLLLNGRDSKIHVTDYPVDKTTLLYSTAEIFTWKKFEDKTVLVLYGGAAETHELAIKTPSTPTILEGQNVTIVVRNSTAILQWNVSYERRVVKVDDLHVYMLGELDRSRIDNRG